MITQVEASPITVFTFPFKPSLIDGCCLQGEEYWRLEEKLCKAMLAISSKAQSNSPDESLSLEEINLCSQLKSFDYRVRESDMLMYDERLAPGILF